MRHGEPPVPARVAWLAVGAVLLYGTIAAWVNREHGQGPMLRSALAQGLSCGLTTASLATLIDCGMAHLLRRGWPRQVSAACIALVAAMLGVGLHLLVNLWARTPELVATVAWPTAALAIYCPVYAAAALKRMP
jgi:fluoride ion exporter CrcB/FEX